MPAGIRIRLACAATLVALVGGIVVAAQPASAAPPAPYWTSAKATIATITLNWGISDPSGVTKFQYQQKEGGGSFGAWTDVPNSGNGTRSFKKTGLTPGTSYTFKLRAVAGATPGAASGTWSKTTEYVPSPAFLSNQFVSTSASITLKWKSDSSNEITKWELRYKLNSAGSFGNWANVGGAATRTHTVSGLTADTEYDFELRAVVGSTPGSAQAYTASTTAAGGTPTPTPTPRVTTAPPAPAWSALQATIATITLNWSISDPSGVTKYQYQQKASGGSWSAWTDIPDSNAGTTSFTRTGLTPGTSYQFKLRAVAGATPGAASNARSSSTDYVPSPAFLHDQFVRTQTSITLKWSAASSNEITRWEVRYKLSSAGSFGKWANVGGATTRTHTVTDLSPNTEYDFELRALVGSASSAVRQYTTSTTAAGRTPTPTPIPTPTPTPTPAPRVTVTAPPAPHLGNFQATIATITLNWSISDSAGVTKYQYQQKAGGGSWSAWTDIPDSNAGTSSFTRTGLTPGTSYRFKLRAVAGATPGTASMERSISTEHVPSGAWLYDEFVRTGASITLKWKSDSSNEIAKWELRYKLSSAGSYGKWTNVGDATTRTHTVSGLTADTQYDFELRALVGSTPGRVQRYTTSTTAAAQQSPTNTLKVVRDSDPSVIMGSGQVESVSVAEGDSENTSLSFRLTLDQTPSHDVRVQATVWAPRDANVRGRSGAGRERDFHYLQRHITFAAGATGQALSKLLTVEIIGDTRDEDDETFEVRVNNLHSGDARVRLHGGGKRIAFNVVISDDDEPNAEQVSATPIIVSVTDQAAAEGDAGVSFMEFPVTLSGSPSHDVRLQVTAWAKGKDTVRGSRKGPGRDFGYLRRHITFEAGASGAALTQTIRVRIFGDQVAEPDETFEVRVNNLLTQDKRVQMGVDGRTRVTATGTIRNDDE